MARMDPNFSHEDYIISKEEYYNYDIVDSNYSPLFLVAHEGNLDSFNTLLDKRELKRYISQRTIMHVAAARGHADIVHLLCQRDILISRKDGNGNTPLHLAVKNNHTEVFNLLLPKSDLNATNFWDKRPLHLAAANNRIQFAEALIKNGADVNAKDMNGQTPVFLALEKRNPKLAELLLQNCSDVFVADVHYRTPLHLATELENIHLVELILKKGAQVNVLQEIYNCTPIEIAAALDNTQLVKILLKYGAKKDQIDKAYKGQQSNEYKTALHFVAKHGNLEMIKLLINNGFDTLNVKDKFQKTPMDLAMQNYHLDVVKYLMNNDSKIIEPKVAIHLFKQCYNKQHIEILEYLIDRGIKSEASLVFSPLCQCEIDFWKLLLKRVSKFDAESYSLETKLHSAVRAGQVGIVKEILKANKEDCDSLSSKLAVFIAVENGNVEMLKILLEAGFSVGSCFSTDLTPLHIAATFEDTRLVEMLLRAGAEISSERRENETTPLDFAAAAGCSDVVKLLLDAGACSNFDTLKYALHRDDDSTTITPSTFQSLAKITEMLIIAEIDSIEPESKSYKLLLYYAIKLRVSRKDEDSVFKADAKFRPEILRCLLNYAAEDKLDEILESIFGYYYSEEELINPDILNVIFEYDLNSYLKLCICSLMEDDCNNLNIIDHIEDIETLLIIARDTHNEYFSTGIFGTDLLKMITARLEMLSTDFELEERKFELEESKLDFYIEFEIYEWVMKCREEIQSMEITNISDDSNVTFYDILSKSVDNVASYINYERLLNTFELSYQKFPIYAKFLKIRLAKGKQRKDLKNMCVNGMISFVKENHKIECSSNDMNEILQYLSVFDLRRLSAAIFSFSK